ncbi:MAG TPA: TonB family protein [Terriglobales bacterium]|nr:TonB family protein [Terriglobales bacterium]
MNAAVAQERWQGQVIDAKYPLLEWIGGSAATTVFRTELPGKPAQPAAIKLVRADSLNPAQQVMRWKELATLSNPDLLRIFDAGSCRVNGAQWVYCVMEHAEEHLDQVLPSRSLSAAEVSELLPPMLDGLAFLHARGLVHSRLKPSNLLAVKNRLKLSTDNVRQVGNGTTANPLSAYDSPEVDSGKLSCAADIWSLGMILVAAFNQRPLNWNRSNPVIPAVPKSIPAPYRLIVRESLRVDPEERCSLERIKELLRPQLPTKPTPKPQAAKAKIIVPVLAVVVLSAIIFGLISFRHTSKAENAATAEQASSETATPQPAPERSVPNPQTNSVTPSVNRLVVERVLPQVPLSARLTVHGKVRVKVRVAVDSNGEVSSATLTSPGPSRYFARLALEASRKWKFTPNQASGQSVPQWLLEYKFGRTATEVNPIELH